GLSYSLGDIAGERDGLRAALAIAPHVQQVALIGQVLGIASGYLARLEADSGNDAAAAAALALNRKYVPLSMRDQPAGSFGRAFLPEYLGLYGYPTGGPGYGEFAIPYARGDFATVHRIGLASAKRMEAMRPPVAGAKDGRDRALEMAWRVAAEASWWLGDYARAEAEITHALGIRKTLPPRNLGEQRDAGDQLVIASMIAARLGDHARAQKILAPVLELQRGLDARKDNEDRTQHIEYAQALYASALATPASKGPALKQAAGLVDALPKAMRGLKSIQRLRGAIAAEAHTAR
ncbi:MAG: hypothetical protein ACREX6_11410, partial [Casimicrobiaceae bacterium]